MKIVMHSKKGCGFCSIAKRYLIQHEIPFTEILHTERHLIEETYDQLGLVGQDRTMPQIIVDDVRLGGAQELLRSGVAEHFRKADVA